MKKLFFLILFSVLPFSIQAKQLDADIFKDDDAALVIYNRSTGLRTDFNPLRSAERLTPCSTFKIYNTLIGLELGLIKGADEPWYQWDGIVRFIDGWNKDLTLREAFRVSAVPAYQSLARQIGVERMKDYIQRMAYGTQRISDDVDSFWLPRTGQVSIMINAHEQVDLLNKLLDHQLPFDKKNIAVLKDVMQVVKTDKGTLYGKTGSGMNEEGQWNLGWFVGFLETANEQYVFACNIKGGENPSGKTARERMERFFKSQGLL